MDPSILQDLYAASLEQATEFFECPVPDFAGAPPRTTLGSYWRTLRHLSGLQFYDLLHNRILPKSRVSHDGGVAVKLRNKLPSLITQWKPNEAKRILPHSIAYIEQLHAFISNEGSRFDAELRSMSAWRAHCYSFANVDLTSAGDASIFRQSLGQIVEWWDLHSTDSAMGRQPLALSLRILNWLKFAARNSARAEELGEACLIGKILQGIRLQTLLLEHCVERHLLNNHLIINAEALMFAGMLLECPESGRWRLTGEYLLRAQLSEQILSDGGQIERSSSYQTWLLEHLVDIRSLVDSTDPRAEIADLLQNRIWEMAAFLLQIKHPDGQIPLLNDTAMDFACTKQELDALLGRAGTKATAVGHDNCDVSVLSASGYGVIRDLASHSHLLLDCGPLGPDYQLGHGHCDILSFELSVRGQRVVVDTGVSTYQAGSERYYERSTAAHNTLRVDGQEQAELWASYRVGRNPKVGSIHGGHIGGLPFLRGEHYAYNRLKVTHCRTVVRQANDCWIILDYLYGTGDHYVESFVHLHPLVQVERQGFDFLFILSSNQYLFTTYGLDKVSVSKSYYCPGYGIRHSRPVIHCNRQGVLPIILVLVLRPADSVAPNIDFRGSDTVTIDGIAIPLNNAGSKG